MPLATFPSLAILCTNEGLIVVSPYDIAISGIDS